MGIQNLQKMPAAWHLYFIIIKSIITGTIQKGILGGFSGKVGTVVGGSWKGIDYMRCKSNRRNFNHTDKQLAQQLKFLPISVFHFQI